MSLNTCVTNFISHLSGEMPVTDHHLLAAKFRSRLPVNKETTQTFGMERFGVIKLNDADIEEKHRHKFLTRFAA
jgi:hypothetical protein